MYCLETRVYNLEMKVSSMVNHLNDVGLEKKRDVVVSAEFERMVDEALAGGHYLGCSKMFIMRFLAEHYKQNESRYVQRKLNVLLKKKVENGEYKLRKNLYSFA